MHQRQLDWQNIREYPLSHDLLAMTCVWKATDSRSLIVASKGAPEAVLGLCKISEANKQSILWRVQALADQGLRVLGVARTEYEGEPLPEDSREFKFQFVGLIGLEDPIRPEVPNALWECYEAGIRVIMMTGDYSGTAKSIAKQIGFSDPEKALTGGELQKLSDLELKDQIRTTNVFARMVPEQKLRVIHALKSNSEIVAMTDDGVNDAPSLKWSNQVRKMGCRSGYSSSNYRQRPSAP